MIQYLPTHAIATMSLDGASDNKPTLQPTLDSVHAHPSIQRPEHKPTRLRRFLSIGSRERKPSSIANLYRKLDNSTPLHTLSQHPTESEPCAPATKLPKRSMSTFLLSRTCSSHDAEPSKREDKGGATEGHLPATETAALALLPAAISREGRASLESRGRLLVTGSPDQSVQRQRQRQPRKDSATRLAYDLPLLASRTAALTSHPVGKEDLECEEFQTPREFGGWTRGGHVDK